MEARNQSLDISSNKDYTTPSYQKPEGSNPFVQITGGEIRPLSNFIEGIPGVIVISLENEIVPEFTILEGLEKAVCQVRAVDLSWLVHLQESHSEKLSREEMTKVIEGVHTLIKNNQVYLLNSVVRDTLTEQSSNESIVVLLRATFPVHGMLNDWKETLQRAKEWIVGRGQDYKSILTGLI